MLVWKAHDRPVYDLAFTPDGHLMSSGDGVVVMWNVASRIEGRRWPEVFSGRFALTSDGAFFVGGGNGFVGVWSMQTTEPLFRFERSAEGVAFSPDGSVFAAHGEYGGLRRWSMSDGKELSGGWGGTRTRESFPTGPLAFNPDGTILATLFGVLNKKGDRYDSVVFLWNAKTGAEVGRLHPTANTSHHATRLAFSPIGALLAGIYGPDLIVWDVATRKEVARRQPSKKHFKGLAFTPDGGRILTANNDSVIQVWAAPNWQPLTTYAWKIGKLGCVAVSADGTLAAAGGSTGKVVVWDLE